MESSEHQRRADRAPNFIDEEKLAICLNERELWEENLAKTVEQEVAEVRALRVEQRIERLLGHIAQVDQGSRSQRPRKMPPLPERFRQEVEERWRCGNIDDSVARYYLESLLQADSLMVCGEDDRESLLGAVLTEDAQPLAEEYARGSEWRPVRSIGRGAYGSVILWEKPRRNRPPLRIATKETRFSSFFQDYCSEAHLTRRLNDLGCKNVINVVEWKFLKSSVLLLPDGTNYWTEPKHRIAYEYAELRDLRYLTEWYLHHELIFPEAFIWHIFHSMANALCYCRHGTNEPRTVNGWDSIVHGDIKLENIFLTQPDPDEHRLYPRIKLADFGLAYTLGRAVTAVQHYKSTYEYGTEGYMAPEVQNHSPENNGRRRAPHELHGPHSDIYSLGKSMQRCFMLVEEPKHTMSQSSGKLSEGVEAAMEVYSPELRSLLERCTEQDPRYRPKTYSLYRETKQQMEMHRDRAYTADVLAGSKGHSEEYYHDRVLFTVEERRRYAIDEKFRGSYRRANLQPLWQAMRVPRRVNLAQQRTACETSHPAESAVPLRPRTSEQTRNTNQTDRPNRSMRIRFCDGDVGGVEKMQDTKWKGRQRWMNFAWMLKRLVS